MTRASSEAPQEPQAAQKISVTQTAATGGPLILNFRDVMRRAPLFGEGPVVLDDRALVECFEFLW